MTTDPMHSQQVIMWLGVELAEKKSEICDLQNENAELRGMLDCLRKKLEEDGEAE